MKKALFLIHDLGPGGAEKVLVNLVNNMNTSEFDITVMTLFDCGINKQFLASHIKYKSWQKKMVRGNSHFMKLFTPAQLHTMIIKEEYDIEVAYLEGPCARVISGCQNPNTKLVSWIHIEQKNTKMAAVSFRSVQEARECYSKFQRIVCVSENVKQTFKDALQVDVPYQVLYNTNDSERIIQMSRESVPEMDSHASEIKLVGVGKLLKSKGFDRILKITKRLIDDGNNIHTYILGEGPERENLQRYILSNGLQNRVDLKGYQVNPYKFVSKCDLFVCASYAEGFSTAATEALILGIPVCTVHVSGMREMLGEKNEYGIVVDNDEISLYEGIKYIITNPEVLGHYRQQAKVRGVQFSKKETVSKTEQFFSSLYSGEE